MDRDTDQASEEKRVNDLIPFEFHGTKVRVVELDGEPWFVGADVCFILGYSNSRDAIAKHVRDAQKRVSRIATPSGDQQMTVVNEGGLYRLLMRARTVLADDFQDWVTDEVLPTIRKTGAYGNRFQLPATYAETLRELAGEVEARELAEAHAKALEPRAAEADHHRAANGLKAVGDFVNDLKAWAKTNHPSVRILHQDVWDQLGRIGMVIRGNTIRHNQPTAKAVENEWCVPKVSDYDTSTGVSSSTTTRLTPKGEGYAWDRITAYIEANGTCVLPRQIGDAS